jgi:Helix-turn-helix of DDE superfamily endonuclease
MRYEKVKNLKESDFKRLCGVKKETFLQMCETVSEAGSLEKRGRKSGLLPEDQVLLTLSYWREYRTMFHLGQDFGMHESNVSRVIQKVEDVLIKCGKFSLPSKRRLLEENELNYTIVDVTEMTIERPKKNKSDVTAEKRSGTHSKVS